MSAYIISLDHNSVLGVESPTVLLPCLGCLFRLDFTWLDLFPRRLQLLGRLHNGPLLLRLPFYHTNVCHDVRESGGGLGRKPGNVCLRDSCLLRSFWSVSNWTVRRRRVAQPPTPFKVRRTRHPHLVPIDVLCSTQNQCLGLWVSPQFSDAIHDLASGCSSCPNSPSRCRSGPSTLYICCGSFKTTSLHYLCH